MLIETALMTYLLAQSGITDIVDTRIYFVKAPQDVAKPYIVFFKVTSPRDHSHDGGTGLANPRFQFSIFSTTYGEAKNIATAVQTALQGYTGTMGGDGGVYVTAVTYEDENDFYENETKLFHVAVDYAFWHEE